MLSPAQREHFLSRGFVRLGQTFSQEFADEWWGRAWTQIKSDPARFVRECQQGARPEDVHALDRDRPETWFRARITFHGPGGYAMPRDLPEVWEAVTDLMGVDQCDEVVHATGALGETYLVHSMMLHAPGEAQSPTLRVLANPNVFFHEPMRLGPDAPGDSLVEQVALRALDR